MREADRAGVIGQVAEKRLRHREAAERLGLSVRQVKRLLARYCERGPSGSGFIRITGRPSSVFADSNTSALSLAGLGRFGFLFPYVAFALLATYVAFPLLTWPSKKC